MYLLLIASCACATKAVFPTLLCWIISFLYMESSNEIILRQKETEIKEKLASLSIVNEFAKYAKLQRQLNKVQEDLNFNSNLRQSQYLKVKLAVNYCVQFMYGCGILFLVWTYMLTPAAVLLPLWIKPFDFILNWPTGVEGGISLSVWLLMMESTFKTISYSIKTK